jgi:hypothetical protein
VYVDLALKRFGLERGAKQLAGPALWREPGLLCQGESMRFVCAALGAFPNGFREALSEVDLFACASAHATSATTL